MTTACHAGVNVLRHMFHPTRMARRVHLLSSVFGIEAELPRVKVPTLIVTGDEDDACLEPGIFLKQRIRTSGLAVIPKAGHTINLEEPETFNRAVLDFLTAVESGRWGARNPASQTGSAILPAGEPERPS